MNVSTTTALLAIAWLACGCAGGAPKASHDTDARASSANGIVTVEQGRLKGLVHGRVVSYRGVPFAAPPVGDLRFRAPAPVESWDGTRDATAFGQHCLATDPYTKKVLGGDEDCLTLNVWAPLDRPAEPIPVLVFVHGGFHVRGSSSFQEGAEYLYAGDWLAQRGPAVVVTLNYRLGAFGFLAHPALTAEDPRHTSGNAGLLDQIAALTWVQKNIAAFGGDPARVLVFGQSAGAIDTCALLTSPLAKDLFSRALMMSGNCSRKEPEEAEKNGVMLAAKVGCTESKHALSCLRDKRASEIAASMTPIFGCSGYAFGPVADGIVVEPHAMKTFKRGGHNNMPLVVGNTTDEYATMVRAYGDKPPEDDADYEDALKRIFCERADSIHTLYPVSNYRSAKDALVTALSDTHFVCQARTIARAVASGQRQPVFRYVFGNRFDDPELGKNGAIHGYDLPFVFHSLPYVYLADYHFSPSPAELALSDSMGDAFLRFAKTGDPNGKGLVAWPRYDASRDDYLLFDKVIRADAGVRTAACDAVDAASR